MQPQYQQPIAMQQQQTRQHIQQHQRNNYQQGGNNNNGMMHQNPSSFPQIDQQQQQPRHDFNMMTGTQMPYQGGNNDPHFVPSHFGPGFNNNNNNNNTVHPINPAYGNTQTGYQQQQPSQNDFNQNGGQYWSSSPQQQQQQQQHHHHHHQQQSNSHHQQHQQPQQMFRFVNNNGNNNNTNNNTHNNNGNGQPVNQNNNLHQQQRRHNDYNGNQDQTHDNNNHNNGTNDANKDKDRIRKMQLKNLKDQFNDVNFNSIAYIQGGQQSQQQSPVNDHHQQQQQQIRGQGMKVGGTGNNNNHSRPQQQHPFVGGDKNHQKTRLNNNNNNHGNHHNNTNSHHHPHNNNNGGNYGNNHHNNNNGHHHNNNGNNGNNNFTTQRSGNNNNGGKSTIAERGPRPQYGGAIVMGSTPGRFGSTDQSRMVYRPLSRGGPIPIDQANLLINQQRGPHQQQQQQSAQQESEIPTQSEDSSESSAAATVTATNADDGDDINTATTSTTLTSTSNSANSAAHKHRHSQNPHSRLIGDSIGPLVRPHPSLDRILWLTQGGEHSNQGQVYRDIVNAMFYPLSQQFKLDPLHIWHFYLFRANLAVSLLIIDTHMDKYRREPTLFKSKIYGRLFELSHYSGLLGAFAVKPENKEAMSKLRVTPIPWVQTPDEKYKEAKDREDVDENGDVVDGSTDKQKNDDVPEQQPSSSTAATTIPAEPINPLLIEHNSDMVFQNGQIVDPDADQTILPDPNGVQHLRLAMFQPNFKMLLRVGVPHNTPLELLKVLGACKSYANFLGVNLLIDKLDYLPLQ